MNIKTLRAGWFSHQIRRYHMIDLNRPQDVAQHSFRVAFLAAHICDVALNRGAVTGVNSHTAFYFGATHDLDEMTTGDIPTHVKLALRTKGIDITNLCDKDAFPTVPEPYKWVVKAADLIESEHYCSSNNSVMDRRGMDVSKYIHEARNQYVKGLTEQQRMVLLQVCDDVVTIEQTPGNYDLSWSAE